MRIERWKCPSQSTNRTATERKLSSRSVDNEEEVPPTSFEPDSTRPFSPVKEGLRDSRIEDDGTTIHSAPSEVRSASFNQDTTRIGYSLLVKGMDMSFLYGDDKSPIDTRRGSKRSF